ncbi:DUF3891 family protein [Bacillus weihaiensis]|uniref:DUF3891 family protein n=1 Tax=Bacillus weihaiensis TaxID=1547283 RepID=UPI0023551EF9|nr:DUF3891 family protein [Bacillus weihaiensis]
MVIFEKEDFFIMTEQHEHASLSRDLAIQLQDQHLKDIKRKKDIFVAIKEHDRGWIDLDVAPLWNDKKLSPYSFIDYPIPIKLAFYRKGIDEVMNHNLFAAMLCSIHYVRFFDGMKGDSNIDHFVAKEKKRQEEIMNLIDIDEKEQNASLEMLKYTDTLSLFFCMQEAAMTRENMHDWFKGGIYLGKKKFDVVWKDRHHVILNPFPFKGFFKVTYKYKAVNKRDISTVGILEAYSHTKDEYHTVHIISK